MNLVERYYRAVWEEQLSLHCWALASPDHPPLPTRGVVVEDADVGEEDVEGVGEEEEEEDVAGEEEEEEDIEEEDGEEVA